MFIQIERIYLAEIYDSQLTTSYGLLRGTYQRYLDGTSLAMQMQLLVDIIIQLRSESHLDGTRHTSRYSTCRGVHDLKEVL